MTNQAKFPAVSGRKFSLILVTVVLPITFVLSSPAYAADGPAVTVLVFNFKPAPSDILIKAENETARIFKQAGIHLRWRDCPTENEPCLKGPGNVFFVAIMAGPVQNEFLDTISGHASVTDHLATVYYDALPRARGKKTNHSDTAAVLGSVMAHELGHLLLGGYGHSISGIMQAYWGVEQVQRALGSGLDFLPEEARNMRSQSVKAESNDNSSFALTSH